MRAIPISHSERADPGMYPPVPPAGGAVIPYKNL
jgi:hypothetical protein